MNKTLVLSDLDPGQSARISHLHPDDSIRRRLQDVGIIPGTLVSCIMKSPFGDPAAYFVRGAIIAIRNCDAAKIPVSISGGGVNDGT